MEEEAEDIPTTKDVLKAGDVYSRGLKRQGAIPKNLCQFLSQREQEWQLASTHIKGDLPALAMPNKLYLYSKKSVDSLYCKNVLARLWSHLILREGRSRVKGRDTRDTIQLPLLARNPTPSYLGISPCVTVAPVELGRKATSALVRHHPP
uniref:Uncharacterized protein n=1 Tax=Timema monikensis TaxID=170555 RepID=A0A7R9HSE8_9NEOP|nr:unnamed protein product [Timema monikensis]